MNKHRILFLMIASILAIAGTAAAQNYPNPNQRETDEWKATGTCVDPWVSMAVSNANAGVRHAHTSNRTDGECDTSQYNGGQWNSYDQLRKAVETRQDEVRRLGQYWESYDIRGVWAGKLLALMDSYTQRPILMSLIGNDGSTLVGNDGASMQPIFARMVAAGGGNMVAAGGGNLTLKQLLLSSNMVAAGGGNAIPPPDKIARIIAAGVQVSFPPNYSIMSVGDKARTFKLGGRRVKVTR